MKEQIIIITGKQGSGKSTIARKFSSLKVIEFEKDWIVPTSINNFVITTQKENLIIVLKGVMGRDYIIIDLDKIS